MALLHRYEMRTKTGHPLEAFGYCENHWQSHGIQDYAADTGRKSHSTIYVEDAAEYCDLCREAQTNRPESYTKGVRSEDETH